MATIDPSIALGAKPIQIEDPLNRFARQQELSVNALKMQEYQRGLEEQNALRTLVQQGIDPNSPDFAKQAYRISPELGIKVAKSQQESRKATADINKTEGEVVDARLKQSRAFLENVTTPEEYIAWHEANHRDPVLGPLLASRGITADQSRARIMNVLKQPGGLQRLILESKLGAEKFQSDLTTRRGQDLTYSAATQPVFSEASGGFYTRPTAGKESTFIPAGGTEMTTKGKAVGQAKENVTTLASEMAKGYKDLLDKKGIKSIEAGAASNLSASSQSSMAGQILGGVFGTEEQDIRDFIKSQRPLLVQSIVKATGMSAQQINSNAELKNILDAATDPSRGYESNIRALNGLNNMFGTGKPILPGATDAAPAPASNINVPGVGTQLNVPGSGAKPAARPSLESIFAPAKK